MRQRRDLGELTDLSKFFISKKLGAISGKAVVRVDINVPVNDEVISKNNLRLKSCAKAIDTYVNNGIIPIILAHQGRKGDDDYLNSLEQHATVLQSMVENARIKYSNSLTDSETEKAAAGLKEGEALLLRNVRDHEDEKGKFGSIDEMKTSKMVKFFSNIADFYINDAPATMHRQDTSLIGFIGAMPSYLGVQMEEELRILKEIKDNMRSVNKTSIIFGGKKWEKFEYIYEIAKNKSVNVLCGGVPGQSICYVMNKKSFNKENEQYIIKNGSLDIAEKLMHEFGDKILYPKDFILEDGENVGLDELRFKKGSIMDIGDSTLKNFFEDLDGSEMIIYAGPVGRYEKGYNQTIRLITRFMGIKALNYTLGGNSADSMDDIGIDKAYEMLDGKRITSGGAGLAYIAGHEIPVLKAFESN